MVFLFIDMKLFSICRFIERLIILHGDNMETLLSKCQRLSNVSVRCQDGLVSTHKIILACVSPFFKRILEQIPVGDEVTVLMPDFGSGEIETFFISWMESPEIVLPKDICRAFGKTSKVKFKINSKRTDNQTKNKLSLNHSHKICMLIGQSCQE